MIIPLAIFFPISELAIISLIGIAGGLYLFFRGFRLLARKRLLLNTPTSKIRSAAMGLVEVSGLATGPYTLPAPITGKACYLYRTTAWQQRESGKNHDWVKVAEETLHVPFFLDDGTGKLLVEPHGAEFDLHRDFREEYGASMFSTRDLVPLEVSNFLERHGVTPSRHIRIEECAIKPKNALFIVGTLAENPGFTRRSFPVSAHDTNRTRPASDSDTPVTKVGEALRRRCSRHYRRDDATGKNRCRAQQSRHPEARGLDRRRSSLPGRGRSANAPDHTDFSERKQSRRDPSPPRLRSHSSRPPDERREQPGISDLMAQPAGVRTFASLEVGSHGVGWRCAGGPGNLRPGGPTVAAVTAEARSY